MKHVEKRVGKYIMKMNATGGGIHKTLRGIGTKKRREPELLYLLEQEIKPGMIVMDLGANIGYITLLMAELVGPKGRVYAMEPDPSNYKLLKYNVRINSFNDRVICYEVAISNKLGMTKFYAGKNASNLGALTQHKKSVSKPIIVKCNTLTTFFQEHDPVNFIKMDIEGAEVQVLDGMYNYIKSNDFPCKIVMELHPMFYKSGEGGLHFWMKKFLESGFKTKCVISAAVPIPDKFKKWGYNEPSRVIRNKGFYYNFLDKHMLDACCHINKQWMPGKKKYSPKIARYVLIERK